MLGNSSFSAYAFTYDNWGANPSTTPGTSVTPGASNAEGSYTQIASTSNIAQDVYWIAIWVMSGATSTSQKDHLLDIGVDQAGGSSYTAVISNIVCGESFPIASGPVRGFVFPLFVKAASSVAVRIQGSAATAGTVRVAAKFWGQPCNPEAVPTGQFSETIGTITNSGGVSFTPGNAADGTWTSLGTTTSDLWWWQLGWQISNGTASGDLTYIDLAVGDGTNKDVILRELTINTSAEQSGNGLQANMQFLTCFHRVPAGSTMYVRGRCSAAPTSGYNAVAVGIGG